MGLALLAGIAFSGRALVSYPIFFAGLAVATLSLAFAKRLSFGPPLRLQIAALAFALGVEGALIAVMGRFLPPGSAERLRWLWVLMIVGVHFIPMAVSFGPRMLVLGAGCICNAAAALILTVPFGLSGAVDGALKLGVGVWLLSARGEEYNRRLDKESDTCGLDTSPPSA
jgi:hypothetical protein